MIADATKEDLANVSDDENAGLLRDGMIALVGILGKVKGVGGVDMAELLD